MARAISLAGRSFTSTQQPPPLAYSGLGLRSVRQTHSPTPCLAGAEVQLCRQKPGSWEEHPFCLGFSCLFTRQHGSDSSEACERLWWKKPPRPVISTHWVLIRGTEQVEWKERFSPLGPCSFIETHPVQLTQVDE